MRHVVNVNVRTGIMMDVNKPDTVHKKEPAYRSLISPRMADDLHERITKALIIDKKYRDRNFSARQLSKELGTNTRYVSVVVSVRFHMNYTSLINKLRVDEAMSILLDKRYVSLKMQDVADMVGFSNRQSFYSAFVKQNGVTPLHYRKKHMAG